MDIETAKRIIEANYAGDDSLTASLNDYSYFSEEKFRAFYESIVFLTENSINTNELSKQICMAYQRILKEMIYHFDPNDLNVLENFPNNYIEYLEKMDDAVRAYFDGNK